MTRADDKDRLLLIQRIMKVCNPDSPSRAEVMAAIQGLDDYTVQRALAIVESTKTGSYTAVNRFTVFSNVLKILKG